MPFKLNDSVLFGLLAVEDNELRALLSAIECVEADPLGACDGAAPDHDGEMSYVAKVHQFRLFYRIGSDGRVIFTQLFAQPSR